MRLDRPSSDGSDNPGGDEPRGRFNPDLFNPYPVRGLDRPSFDDRPRQTGEGTGWPKDKPNAKPDTKTDAEKLKDLESENKSLRSENTRLAGNYERSLKDLRSKDNELGDVKSELSRARTDNSRLVDTNSRLVRDNMQLRDKTAPSSLLDQREKSGAEQHGEVESKPRRKNWFPTDKVGSAGSAVAGAAGAYGVMVGRVASKEEAFAVACAGAGVATLALGREVTDKINAWRDKRAEKKNADR